MSLFCCNKILLMLPLTHLHYNFFLLCNMFIHMISLVYQARPFSRLLERGEVSAAVQQSEVP